MEAGVFVFVQGLERRMVVVAHREPVAPEADPPEPSSQHDVAQRDAGAHQRVRAGETINNDVIEHRVEEVGQHTVVRILAMLVVPMMMQWRLHDPQALQQRHHRTVLAT